MMRPSLFHSRARKFLAIAFGLLVGPVSAFLIPLAIALPAQAQEPPVCTGKDLIAEMERNDPQALAAPRKEGAETPNGQGIFWKVERDGTEPSYLLGTMHVTDPRIVAMPEEARLPFDEAETVAVEIDNLEPLDIARTVFAHPELTMFTDGTSVHTLLDAKEVDQLETLLKQLGIPLFAVAKMKPWMLIMHISVPPCEKARAASGIAPLDLELIRAAHEQDKLVVGLETALEQLQSMNMVESAPLLRAFLLQMGAADKLGDMFTTMTDMYLEGEIGMFIPFSYRVLGVRMEDDPSYSDFMKNMVTDRNIRMAERATPLLKTGNAFIAVGAMHLIGEQGLVELFRKQGYTVTRLH